VRSRVAIGAMLEIVTLVAAALGASALAFALWQLLVVADSLSGLWLIFWAMGFGPVFLVLGVARLWRESRAARERAMSAPSRAGTPLIQPRESEGTEA
jgi:hypothetical protein